LRVANWGRAFQEDALIASALVAAAKQAGLLLKESILKFARTAQVTRSASHLSEETGEHAHGAESFAALLRDYAAKTSDRKARQLLLIAAAKIDELEKDPSPTGRWACSPVELSEGTRPR
jgi:hypothetical protein